MWVACVEPGPDHADGAPARPGRTAPTTVTLPADAGRSRTCGWPSSPPARPAARSRPVRIYEYELTAPWESTRPARPHWDALSLAPATRPTFLAPPAAAVELVVYHTSCRKPHGGGRDGLALALERSGHAFLAARRRPQPHLLVLSGDQIYADEVGHPLMPRVLRVGEGPDRRRRDRRVRLAAADRRPRAGARRRSGTPARPPTTCGATASSWPCTCWRGRPCSGRPRSRRSPRTRRSALPDVDPDVTEESWDEDRDQRRAVPYRPPGGAHGPRQRPVADDLRRPRDHRRLEHRPRRG